MNQSQPTLITHLSWGHMEVTVHGEVLQFRDSKVWPDGACAWNWQETGTHHQPGIQISDIEDLLARGVDVIILGCGRLRALGVCPETKAHLQQRGVVYYAEETSRAVERYNQLALQGKRVGGVFHTTC